MVDIDGYHTPIFLNRVMSCYRAHSIHTCTCSGTKKHTIFSSQVSGGVCVMCAHKTKFSLDCHDIAARNIGSTTSYKVRSDFNHTPFILHN